MLKLLLTLPIDMLRIAYYALRGLVDALRAHNRLRFEHTVLISAPRDAIWRLSTGERVGFDGPPVIETSREPVPDSDDLYLTQVTVGGQPTSRIVMRELECDEIKGVSLWRSVPHPLSTPPEGGRDCVYGAVIQATQHGTTLTVSNEFTVRSFRDRIIYPVGLRRTAKMIKKQCEREAGANSRLATLADHGFVLSIVALLSFCYLFGWQSALLLSIIIVLHEAGHAVAMWMVGVGVRGIYLIPLFGGATVPKTAYRTEARLGFIALMGPCLSLIPTLGLAAMYAATGGSRFLYAAVMFAFINVANLLPIYPLDGGLILNALLGSISREFARIVGWVGVMAGLGVAIYLQSFLIGIPFLLFALQRYLSGGSKIEMETLSRSRGAALALASIATVAAYIFVLDYLRTASAVQAASRLTAPEEVVLYVRSDIGSANFIEPLVCALRHTLVAPVSTRKLDLPLGSEVAVTPDALDADKVAGRFAQATADQGSKRTFKYFLLGEDLTLGRQGVYGIILGNELWPDPGGILSTARIEEASSGFPRVPSAEVTAQRAYKLILRMISRSAGYTNPKGCVLAFHNGNTAEIDATSSAFCNWDRAVLVAARIVRTDAGADCPHAAQADAASSTPVRSAFQ